MESIFEFLRLIQSKDLSFWDVKAYVEFPRFDFYVHIFKSTEFTGTIRQNSDEVETFWQNAEDIPYGEMREADQDFIPEILSGKYVKKRYIYDENFKLQKIICL